VVVAGFAATRKGCSYFPFSGSTLETLARDLEKYERTKGSLHFSPDEPLPVGLVRKLIRTRIAEIDEPSPRRASVSKAARRRRR
jgi:uncharacterized protein YdhG (YjbR/CyaY superfamily)